jgi:hypothetical protein
VIGQVIAIGDGRPFNVAPITLDPDVAPALAEQHGEDAVLAEVKRERMRRMRAWPAWSRSRSSRCCPRSGSPAATS